MSELPIVKRQHSHATGVPTGYWEGPRPAPYGNFEQGICEGVENCDYWSHFYQQHNSHILGMFITWGFITAVVLIAGIINFSARRPGVQSHGGRTKRALGAFFRRRLLPQSLYGLFPRVTRLQGLIALLLTLYCVLFSFIGISYGTWVNPTMPPGRRIGFLEFSGDRTGCLAFAFVPLVFVLSSRDNIFSLVTGISYQHFNFLHRLIGRFIFGMTWIHTLLWSVELGLMYQPQPDKYVATWKKRYWKWGVGATALLTFLFVHSLRSVQRWTGYEVFRKSHELVAVLFLGACWGHWPKLREWMIAGIAIVFFDRIVRYTRIFFIHMNWTSSETGAFGLHSFESSIERHQDSDTIDVLVLRVKGSVVWNPGQHFFLTFPTLSFFESHPFTPSSLPTPGAALHEQLYIIRALNGQTKRLAQLCKDPGHHYPLPTIVCGAYGTPTIDPTATHYQFIAGGTGVSFTLPLAEFIIASAAREGQQQQQLDFVWIIRRAENLVWVRAELLELEKKAAAAPGVELVIRIFVTRESAGGSSSSSTVGTGGGGGGDVEKESAAAAGGAVSWLDYHYPSCKDIVEAFRDNCVGRIQVLGSGPSGLGRDLRESVARCNDGARVWKGDVSGEVSLYWDSREY